MPGTISTILTAVEARLVALGFKQATELFDFNVQPSSIADKAFRIETRLVENPYYMDQQANPKEAIEIYIAYAVHRDPVATGKTALDDRERIETDIINAAAILALASDPLLVLDREASLQKYLGDYLISRVVFTCDYLRNISA